MRRLASTLKGSRFRELVRPLPPPELREEGEAFAPADEVRDWLRAAFLDPDGALYNEDHEHLDSADIDVLWTNVYHFKQQRHVVGMLEIPNVMGHKWLKGRMEHQLIEWFGRVPDFLMTLYAPFCFEAPDATFCAGVDHELYHGAQAVDRDGCPRFTMDGLPIYAIRGHDAEEHIGVVRRWGVGAAAGGVAELVEAAKRPPEIVATQMRWACGTCLRMAA